MMKFKSIFLAALALPVLLSIDSFAQSRAASVEGRPPGPPPTSQTSPPATGPLVPRQALLIGSGDLLDVSLYGAPDFKTQVRVNSVGEISLPLLGTVAVARLSVEQAEKRIARELIQKGLFNDPQVTVFVQEYATQGISVLGEVQKPGIYQLLGARNLFDAISAAGGTTPKAGRYALITHRNDPEHPVRVALPGDAHAGESNVSIQAGDTIVVSKAGLVYVVGDVRQPGGFVMENDRSITVLQALALAQGLGPNPALNSAKVIRKTPDGLKNVPLPLKKILAAKAPDLQLRPDDIVFVPESAGKSAAKRGAEAIVQMATGVAVWRIP